MNVLVDTCVWSHYVREFPTPDISRKLGALICDDRAFMIGPVRQELLSGISSESKFATLKVKAGEFEDLEILPEDYIEAAQYSNTCRKHGIQGSPTDFLICAVAIRLDIPIFTVDNDFGHYGGYIPISLYD